MFGESDRGKNINSCLLSIPSKFFSRLILRFSVLNRICGFRTSVYPAREGEMSQNNDSWIWGVRTFPQEMHFTQNQLDGLTQIHNQ